jgi:hypothetical protein
VRHLFVYTLLLVCLSVPFAGQADQWSKYSNQEGNFSVLLPVTPSDTPNGDQNAPLSHTIQALSGGISYTIVYVVTKPEQPVDEATFKIYRDSFLKGLPNCDLLREDPASPALSGFVGHWYRLNCTVQNQKLSMIGNLYWGKHHAYAVLTMFATAASDPPNARKFSNSFAVLDTGK